MIDQKDSSIERLSKLRTRHEYNRERWDEWRRRALEARNYYANKQWDEAVKQSLEDSGRVAWTLNMVRPLVDTISGFQRQNRRDIKAVARRGANDTGALVQTALLRHSMDIANGHHAQSEQFTDGLKSGKGWVHLKWDKDGIDPFSGDLLVEHISWMHVMEDGDSQRYDLSDAKMVEFGEWIDREYIHAKYPKLFEQEDNPDGMTQTTGIENSLESSRGISDWAFGDEDADNQLDDDNRDRTKHRYWVVTTYWRQPVRRITFLDKESYEQLSIDPANRASVQNAGAWLEQHAGELLMTIPPEAMGKVKKVMQWLAQSYPDRFAMADRIVNVVNRTKRINDREIDHADDYMQGLDIIPMFRFCPYWDEGHVWGVIDGLKDPQQWANKLYSQTVNLLNQTINAGWIVDGPLSPANKAFLQRFGATPGGVIERNKFGNPEKIKPNPISEGHLTLAQTAPELLKAVSGVNQALLGGDSESQESGKLNQLRQQQGLTVLEPVFDNMDWTTRLMAEGMVQVIAALDIYPKEEIVQIVDGEDLLDPELMAQAQQEVMAVVEQQFQQAGLRVPNQTSARDTVGLLPEQAQQIMAVDAEDSQVLMATVEPFIRERAIELLVEQMDSFKFGRYNVEVTDSPHSPIMRLANFAELKEMAEAGIPIPPTTMIEASGLPKAMKDDIIAQLGQMQQQAQGAVA